MEFLYVFGLIFSVFGIAFFLLNLKLVFAKKVVKKKCASSLPGLKGRTDPCTTCHKGHCK